MVAAQQLYFYQNKYFFSNSITENVWDFMSPAHVGRAARRVAINPKKFSCFYDLPKD